MNFQNINVMKNDKTNSVVLSLEQLSKEYSNTLIKYNQAQLDYNNYLNKNKTNQLTELKSTAFWGTSGISQGNVNDINQCKAMCLSNSKCSGATYNPDKKYCWIRSGDGPVVPSLPNDYSIIPEQVKLLSQINIYNQRLLEINNKISNIINNNISLYTNQSNNRTINNTKLNTNYKMLMVERERINQQIKNFESLDKEQNNYGNLVTYNYYWYFIFMAIAFFLIYLLMKATSYGKIIIDATTNAIDTTKNVIVDAGNQVVDTGKVVVDASKEAAVNAGEALVNAGNEIKDAAVNAGDAVVNAGKEAVDAGNNLITQTKEAITGPTQQNVVNPV